MANDLVSAAIHPQPQAYAPNLGDKRRKFRAFEDNKRRELDEAQEHRRYYFDKQWTDAQKAKLKARGQAATHRNRIRRKIDFLVGVEQRMRRDPKAYPRNPNDQNAADVATAALRFACEINRWEKKASDVAHDGLVSGIGVLWVGIEPNSRGNEVVLRHVAVDRFFYDPRSIEADFDDAGFKGVHLWIDIEDAVAMYPEKENELRNVMDTSEGITALKAEEDRDEQWGDFEHNRVRIVEFYERRKSPEGDVWYYCKFCGNILLESGVSPYLDEEGRPDCPYVCWSPSIDEKGDRHGPIRTMLPVQDEINHRASRILHRLTTRQFYYEEGKLEDIDEIGKQLARPDGKIKIPVGSEWGKSVGIIDGSLQLKGEEDMLTFAISEIENLGPNPGLIGQGGGVADQSGRAILAQRDSGMTELSPIFERLRDWKIRVYRKIWARIRQAWTSERYIRVTDNPEAPQFIGINQYGIDPMTGMAASANVIGEIDVDIILEEGPDTITMQEELMAQFSQLGEAAAGPLGKVLIELSNVANKERLFKLIDEATAPAPEVVEMQQRMAKLEEMLAASKIDESVATIENKRADTIAKLATAMTPKPAPTDKMGLPTGPATQPDPTLGLQALQAFPLQFGGPTYVDLAASAGSEPPMPEDMPVDGGPMPAGMPPEMMPFDPSMLPPQGQPMPGGF